MTDPPRTEDMYITMCHHIRVTETCSPSPNRQDDRLTHWRCLDCGDTFPLIGDDDRWRAKALLPPCLNCGHPLYAHDLIPVGRMVMPSADGSFPIPHAHVGRCACGRCRYYEEDDLPLVTQMLGLDVRRVIEPSRRDGN